MSPNQPPIHPPHRPEDEDGHNESHPQTPQPGGNGGDTPSPGGGQDWGGNGGDPRRNSGGYGGGDSRGVSSTANSGASGGEGGSATADLSGSVAGGSGTGKIVDAAADKSKAAASKRADSDLERGVIEKGDQAAKAAEKAAVASGAGAPAVIAIKAARVVLPWAAKPLTYIVGGAAGLGLMLLFTLSGIFGGPGSVPYAEPENGQGAIPAEMLAAYHRMDSPALPWTILAAIGEVATDHGRRSPYDTVDRAPLRGTEFDAKVLPENTAGTVDPDDLEVATYPRSEPAIGDAGLEEAQGFLLLWPELIIEYPELDPQDVDDALEIAVTEIFSIMEEMQAQGIEPPADAQDPSEIDEYWVQVLDQFRGGRVPEVTREEGCGLDYGMSVDVAIATAFRCAGTGSEQVVTGGANGGTEGAYKTVTGVEAIAVLVEDAIGLGYAWGWQGATSSTHPWELKNAGEWGGPGCVIPEGGGAPTDSGADTAGALPLTAAEAAELGIADRCDTIEVVSKVAEAVTAGARVPVDERGEDSAAFDGWTALSRAVGDAGAQRDYRSSLAEVEPPGRVDLNACAGEWEVFFFGDGGVEGDRGALGMTLGMADGPGPEKGALALGGSVIEAAEDWIEAGRDESGVFSDTQAGLRTRLENRTSELVSEDCIEEMPIEVAWGSLRDQFGHTHDADAIGVVAGIEGELAGMDVWLAYVSLADRELSRQAEVAWGRQVGVKRFAVNDSDRVALGWAPEPPASIRPAIPSIGFGRQVVVTAIRLGGLFLGDERGGTVLPMLNVSLALLPTNKCLVPNNAPCPEEAATHIRDQATRSQMQSQGVLVPIGGPASPCPWMGGSLGRAEFVERLQMMCADAAAEGVKIPGAWGSRTYAEQVSTRASWCARGACTMAATPGTSFHEWGLAFDLAQTKTVYDWVHQIVGCYAGDVYQPDPTATYRALAQPLTREAYVASNPRPCDSNEYPVKRANLYGVVFPVCKGPGSYPARLKTDTWIMCSHEPWHAQPGVLLSVSFDTADQLFLTAGTAKGCLDQAQTMPLSGEGQTYHRQRVGQMVWSLFHCVLRVNGYESRAPSNVSWRYQGRTYAWDGRKLGFANLAEQIASEALVVAYCESLGYQEEHLTSNNFTGKYGGVFQMGDSEMTLVGVPLAQAARLKFEPAWNTYGAALLFLKRQNSANGAWDGWQPWAVVNTAIGSSVKVANRTPVLPRFGSTTPGVIGVPGGELPGWAVNPYAYEIPAWQGTGCPSKVSGGSWPAATPLPGSEGSRATPSAQAQVTRPILEFVGGDQAARAQMNLAVDRFVKSGLQLPPSLKIDYTCPPREGLRGLWNGKYVCIWNPEFSTAAHELGHVYDTYKLTDDIRERFRQRVGMETWNSQDYPWNKRASEKAADVFAWAVDPERSNNAVFAEYAEALGLEIH